MKKIIATIMVIGVLLAAVIQAGIAEEVKAELQGTITISGAWALYPMVVKWAEEFQKIHPKVKIDVAAGGAGKGMADCLAHAADIGMVSREIYPEEAGKGAWWVPVTRDAVVPVISEDNPLLKDILSKGLKKENFQDIWITGKLKDWNEIIESKSSYLIRSYTRSDACGAAETLAAYLGKKQEDLLGIGIYGDPGIAEAVRKDGPGIGYNNINYVYDTQSKMQVNGIAVVPIDLNGNGRIDEDENFYNTRDEIVKAIALGKYPSPPSRNLHFVSGGKPAKEAVVEFIKWVLSDGQKYVPECGYVNLAEEQLKAELKKLE